MTIFVVFVFRSLVDCESHSSAFISRLTASAHWRALGFQSASLPMRGGGHVHPYDARGGMRTPPRRRTLPTTASRSLGGPARSSFVPVPPAVNRRPPPSGTRPRGSHVGGCTAAVGAPALPPTASCLRSDRAAPWDRVLNRLVAPPLCMHTVTLRKSRLAHENLVGDNVDLKVAHGCF